MASFLIFLKATKRQSYASYSSEADLVKSVFFLRTNFALSAMTFKLGRREILARLVDFFMRHEPHCRRLYFFKSYLLRHKEK